MRDTGLADRIRAKGVTVVEVAGWKERGREFPSAPKGSGNHHTAGSASGSTPSLNTCINGRPDVVGPLANVMQSREPVPSQDKAYVIASGKANHGGVGTWTGNSGTVDSNYESEGLEVEHVGTTTVHPDRLEISARIQAAMLEVPGGSRDASMCWQHFEYARPLGRKIDFNKLSPHNADTFRDRVRYWIGRTIDQPNYEEELEVPQPMIHVFKGKDKPEWFIGDMAANNRHVETVQELGEIIWVTVANGGTIGTGPNHGPEILSQATVNAITRNLTIEKAETITIKAIQAELKRLNTEVLAWKAAVEAAG